jgi:ribosomal protein S18 acetylase RimI-like enzyme
VDETAAYILNAGIGPKAPIEALLAWREGVAVGFASFNKLYPTDDGRLGVHMKDLFITPSARGHGIGQALMVALAQICQERGYKRLIWTTTHDNEAAIRLYDGFGAERQNEKLHYRLNTDAIARLSETG